MLIWIYSARAQETAGCLTTLYLTEPLESGGGKACVLAKLDPW